MKIRIEGDSVRLRLRRSEVSELAKEGEVRWETHFPQGIFQYSLQLSKTSSELEARYDTSGIALFLPVDLGEAWAHSDQVGFEHSQPLEGGGTLHLLIEKDFVCLDRDPVGQEDQYPNPKARD